MCVRADTRDTVARLGRASTGRAGNGIVEVSPADLVETSLAAIVETLIGRLSVYPVQVPEVAGHTVMIYGRPSRGRRARRAASPLAIVIEGLW